MKLQERNKFDESNKLHQECIDWFRHHLAYMFIDLDKLTQFQTTKQNAEYKVLRDTILKHNSFDIIKDKVIYIHAKGIDKDDLSNLKYHNDAFIILIGDIDNLEMPVNWFNPDYIIVFDSIARLISTVMGVDISEIESEIRKEELAIKYL